ncbi:hypothetical protein [Marinifilum caeruleilacunae]|uniref:Secreted protein n=1 Tax=Marinifilum caeruleilacunae TaxID=2499076 RepID=A0ABX1X0J5_9BACT|nr:hypothetical protein [Marinifilum caeruleilacunae]NOU61917.1 hypothetical protein [Marinifilum caeruleilacunae]
MLRNIVTMLLLGFYLTGFCGVHFIKHSCFSCDHSEIHLTADADCSDSKDCHCCCNQDDHDKKHHPETADLDSVICCDYDLVYLKTNPNTTITETSKAPLALETLLFVINTLSTYKSSMVSPSETIYIDDYPDDYIRVDRNKLCTFIC